MTNLHRRAALALALLLSLAASFALTPTGVRASTVPMPASVARADGTAVDVVPSYSVGVDGAFIPPGTLLASGVAALTQSFTAPGNTAAWAPVAGRPITAKITGTATGLSARLTRSDDDGATWQPITIGGLPWAVYTGNVLEQAWVETEAPTDHPILFRIEVTAITGGTATVRISQ